MSGACRRRLRSAASRIGLLIALVAAGSASAADLKVGYIDSSRIFQEYKEAQEAQARFDRQVQGWREEAEEKDRAVKKLRDEVREMSPVLSALKRQEKEEALQKAIAAHEQFVQSIWGPQGRATQENERATQEVVNQIRAVVEKIAGEKALDLVFDSSGGFLIYADKSLDMTSEVIRQLNERAASGGSR
jgi:outer membrane protein